MTQLDNGSRLRSDTEFIRQNNFIMTIELNGDASGSCSPQCLFPSPASLEQLSVQPFPVQLVFQTRLFFRTLLRPQGLSSAFGRAHIWQGDGAQNGTRLTIYIAMAVKEMPANSDMKAGIAHF